MDGRHDIGSLVSWIPWLQSACCFPPVLAGSGPLPVRVLMVTTQGVSVMAEAQDCSSPRGPYSHSPHAGSDRLAEYDRRMALSLEGRVAHQQQQQ
mmetsp:Transcript_18502/g.51928  ORF Transcript_18502/g.51928 Transcript_18502/m.51928 type:complete len:95 (+) Transcript_18502:684-968(+)